MLLEVLKNGAQKCRNKLMQILMRKGVPTTEESPHEQQQRLSSTLENVLQGNNGSLNVSGRTFEGLEDKFKAFLQEKDDQLTMGIVRNKQWNEFGKPNIGPWDQRGRILQDYQEALLTKGVDGLWIPAQYYTETIGGNPGEFDRHRRGQEIFGVAEVTNESSQAIKPYQVYQIQSIVETLLRHRDTQV